MRTTGKALFLTLLLLATIPMPVLAIDQVVDNYTDETKVAGKHLTVRNTTYDAMELLWGASTVPWDYQRQHNITGSTNDDVTDYQILIKVHYGAGADSGNDVYLDGACQIDFDDVRFADSDGTTELDYWLERKIDSNYADFWVKIPSILESPTLTSFYICYGFAGATTSDMNATFPIYANDFEGYALGENPAEWQYDLTDTTATVRDDRVAYGAKSLKMNSVPNLGGWMRLNASLSGDYDSAWTSDGVRVIYYYQFDLAARWNLYHADKNVRYYCSRLCRDDQNDWRHLQAGWQTVPNVQAPTVDTWKRMEDLIRAIDMRWNLQTAYETAFSGWITKAPTATPDGTFQYYRIGVQSTTQADPIWVDNFVVGKYIEPEPTHGGWGSQESVGPGYKQDGHFYTTDILDGIDYNSTAVLLNSTVPGGDSITVEFSQDNSSWTLNDWEPIFGGYEAIDLRLLNYTTMYFRFNFTDGGADSTPRLYQVRLIHNAPGANGNGDVYLTGSIGIFLIAFIIILPIIFYAVKRR